MVTQTEVELYVRIKPYYEFLNYISSLPDVTQLNATIILADIGVNINIFDDAKHLCSWCGLSPSNNESDGENKSVRITKVGAYLKLMIVQCALAAIKNKKQPYFAIKYCCIKKRRGHKKAIIAIARMMMVSTYHIIYKKQPFNLTDYEELLDPHYQNPKVVLNDAKVFVYPEAQGFDTSLLVKCNDN
ncbi:transposase [Natranaerovirga hydrolytica]|uniref:transposase n=1 Tax=Natranaerovirga hydrolytica TaxID=680378 RepID=UPI001FAAF0AB|nr:transposase [Natranaerovirga hydrolytica]